MDFLFSESFREEGVVGGRVGIGMLLGMGRVCVVRRGGALEVTGDVAVREYIRLVMFVSSSPVST